MHARWPTLLRGPIDRDLLALMPPLYRAAATLRQSTVRGGRHEGSAVSKISDRT